MAQLLAFIPTSPVQPTAEVESLPASVEASFSYASVCEKRDSGWKRKRAINQATSQLANGWANDEDMNETGLLLFRALVIVVQQDLLSKPVGPLTSTCFYRKYHYHLHEAAYTHARTHTHYVSDARPQLLALYTHIPPSLREGAAWCGLKKRSRTTISYFAARQFKEHRLWLGETRLLPLCFLIYSRIGLDKCIDQTVVVIVVEVAVITIVVYNVSAL